MEGFGICIPKPPPSPVKLQNLLTTPRTLTAAGEGRPANLGATVGTFQTMDGHWQLLVTSVRGGLLQEMGVQQGDVITSVTSMPHPDDEARPEVALPVQDHPGTATSPPALSSSTSQHTLKAVGEPSNASCTPSSIRDIITTWVHGPHVTLV